MTEQLIYLLFLHFSINRRAHKFSDRPIVTPPLHGNLLDPYIIEHNERNLLCECCIIPHMILKIAPNNANFYFNRGIAKLNSGQKQSACLDFKKAKDLGYSDPNNVTKEYCE